MCPILFKIGPLPLFGTINVYSYGLMMGIAFLIANYVAVKEFTRKGFTANFANEVTVLAIIFGLAGSKILSLVENWGDFLNDPIGMAFSPGGLTWYGGFVLATLVIWWDIHKKRYKFLTISDALAPALILGYGVARLGCHFSGDGDYGIPTSLPWGVNYSKGIVPPSVAFRDFPQIAAKFPNGIVPDNTPLHPTPVYEFIAGAIIFYVLWRMRKTTKPDGKLFMVYLVLSGLERFFVEFIRINPRLLFGLSEAQLVSIVLIIIGVGGLIYFRSKNRRSRWDNKLKRMKT